MLLKTSLRTFFAHKGRMFLSLFAIVLSVAFVSGTLVFSNTATSTFDKLFASTASDVSVTQTPPKKGVGPSGGGNPLIVPAKLVQRVAVQPGVKSAKGAISVANTGLVNSKTNKAIGSGGGGPTIVGAWVPGPRTPLTITSGSAPVGSGQMMIDADTATAAKLHVGDRIRAINELGTFDYTISGIATFTGTNPGATLGYLDVPTAQHDLLGTANGFTSIEVFGTGSASNDRLKSEITAAIGTGYDVKTAAQQKADNGKDVGSFLNFMKDAMLGFAFISLLVGGFLIVNTFSMLVAQRTREIGLMRALGGSRRQVNRSVLIEALLLGVIGSTLGMLSGLGVAVLLIRLMAMVGMKISSSLTIGANVPIACYGVGIIVTVLAAWLPARRAGKISPMAALREHGAPVDKATNRKRIVLGLVLTVLGAAFQVVGAMGGQKGEVIGGASVTMIGVVVLGPLLVTGVVGLLGKVLPAVFGTSGTLAQRNTVRNPRRTGATAAALMIGLTLVTGFSVVASSTVSSSNAHIDRSLAADYLVDGGQTGLTSAMLASVKRTPGLDHVTEEKFVMSTLTPPKGPGTDLAITAVSPSILKDLQVPAGSGSMAAVINDGGISIDQTFATQNNLKVGDMITVDYGKGWTQSVPVRLITTEGNPFFDRQSFIAISTVAKVLPADRMPVDGAFFVKAASGADKARTYQALQDSLTAYPLATVQDRAGFKQLSQQRVSVLLNLIYGLLALAIIVAVLGVINTLALSVVERTREIGLLRAIGLSRRQLRSMIRLESVVIAVFGALIGTGLGVAWGIADQRAEKATGMNVLSLPVTTIVVVLLLSAVVGLLAALVPAFRAGRMNVLTAIASD
ncbi:ABC transporter permease [Streptomyces sp. NPDC056683]|uniref:ABC transporter permease n=1 Tax=Streptomyces sp. NPDC056683 TaxID=3345910 RepID=UPI0036BE5B1A